MANEAYRPNTAQDLIKMYNLDSLIADRKQTKASAEKIKVLEETSNSLKDFAEEVEKQIEDLEKIADGKITTYYYSGVPTLTNFPANEWTVDEYENHIGDMYYDKETGNAYKFLYDNETGEYLWRQEINAELSEALARANAAQETADRKKQIFVDTPYPPYQIGDLWLKDDKVIYRCRAEKTEGEYSENDWKVATDFTNDDYAKNVEEQLNQYKVTVEKITQQKYNLKPLEMKLTLVLRV
jgi:phage-related protein